MNRQIKLRLVIFIAVIALLAALVVWTAYISWRRINDLQTRFSAVQWKSFQVADHLQETILSLNNIALRYGAYQEPEDWTNFDATSKELGVWIDSQKPILSSEMERPILTQIKGAYGDYLAAATNITFRIYTTRQSITRAVEFADLERQSKHVLDLGFQLSQVHQVYLDTFQTRITKSFYILRITLLTLLLMLFVALGWLAVVVYREMIAPLQVRLVESQQLAERQEKLASLGMLAAGVAHEIRNPLTAIKTWLFIQQKHLKPGTPEYDDANVIGGEINRLERIVKDFLQFARPSDPKFAVVPAEQPLQEVQMLMQPELAKSDIKLVLEKNGNALIQIDPQQIKQVLINLVQNAADSIGTNGTVTLRAYPDEKRLNDQTTEVVILEVADTGKGITAGVEKRLFDPFFTTKDVGTGLGLPIAARIVERHHGAFQYQNRPDHGAVFGIILPLQKQ